MAMATNRSYGQNQPPYPGSPAPTTASSLNYSTYASSQFTSPSRHGTANAHVSSGSYGGGGGAGSGRAQPSRSLTDGGPGLRPPGGGARPKGESREVAKVHWRALRDFLREWLEKESPTARASAREKLTRLTKLQFQELSTDVYDELMRRLAIENGGQNNEPFLAVREDFHPKRNQARQKLATLPKNRFKDLASDVFHELRRRYPDFDEEERARGYDDEPPPAPGPTNRPAYNTTQSQSSVYRDRERANPTPPPVARLNSTGHSRSGSRNISAGSSVGSGAVSRPRPSRDNTREYLDDSQTSGGGYGHQPTAATNDVVVPNKSRMKEEEIEVPYARESIMDRPLSTASSRSRASSMHDRNGARTPGRDRDGQDMLSPQTADERVYYDRLSFSSNVTSKSRPGGQVDDEREKKIIADYEYKIAGLERRIAGMEDVERRGKEEKERTRELEDEIRGLKERAALHASNLRSLQHELDLARDAAEAARSHTDQSGRQAQEEINQWRDRCEGLEEELRRVEVEKSALESANSVNGAGNTDEAVGELKNEIHNLVDELNSLSARNDDLVTEREHDAQAMNEMEARVAEWKRKHDAVRIELRNLKATSTMFISKPANDDHLPASPDGNIADMHVSAFQSAIDGMLAAGRSSAPSGVLPAMKAIVEAITDIGEDVKAFEAHPNLDVDVSRLESLKHESTTRLNYLMQAARNHAMASGLSPVSLIDAAAGHLSANVVEIIKLLKIRRTRKDDGTGGGPMSAGLRPNRSSMSIKDMVDRTRTGTPDHSNSVSARDRLPSRNAYAAGPEERLREQPAIHPLQVRQLSVDNGNGNSSYSRSAGSPIESRGNGPPNLRINSYQSVASSIARSDSFDLERKASVLSDRQGPGAHVQRGESSAGYDRNGALSGGTGGGYGRLSEASETSRTSKTSGSSSAVAPVTADQDGGEGYRYNEHDEQEVFSHEGGDEQEWDDVKPYLETQSSALVNSIQNLLAAIRTGTQTPALNEHLSEVIAVASSIVAISTNALPPSLRGEGGPLLKDLVANTNKLSEAQEQAKGGGFDKAVRQVIASASFGVAKSLKSLMKLGTE